MTATFHDRPPVLAIVGRPNVGKSTLFNRIVGRRVAIVHEQPGVTRDRISAVARWRDKTFEVIDTGGIAFLDDEKTGDTMAAAVRQQAEVAIDQATVIVLVVDVTAGPAPLDLEIARSLRTSGKTVLLAINKADNLSREAGAPEFAQLGFDRMFSISAVHGVGVGDLVEAAAGLLPGTAAPGPEHPTRIAIVGRPNVGKSSLINRILESDRTIVSEIPGTTRDSVEVPFSLVGSSPSTADEADERSHFMLIDTAGLRHRRKIQTSVDQFGLMRAEQSIRQCDIALLVLDALDGVTKQDQRIAGQIVDANRGCVIVVNKWDLAAEQEAKTRAAKGAAAAAALAGRGNRGTKRPKSFRDEYLEAVRRELFFLGWAPVLFVSAQTGQGMEELFPRIAMVQRQCDRRVETPALNQLVRRSLESYPPPATHGQRFKVYYAFQKSSRPPTFTMFVNNVRALTPHYRRFLTDRIRAAWEFTGWPVVLELRPRPQRDPRDGRTPYAREQRRPSAPAKQRSSAPESRRSPSRNRRGASRKA